MTTAASILLAAAQLAVAEPAQDWGNQLCAAHPIRFAVLEWIRTGFFEPPAGQIRHNMLSHPILFVLGLLFFSSVSALLFGSKKDEEAMSRLVPMVLVGCVLVLVGVWGTKTAIIATCV